MIKKILISFTLFFLVIVIVAIFSSKGIILQASGSQQGADLVDVQVTTYFDELNQIPVLIEDVVYGTKLQFDNNLNPTAVENYSFVFWILNGVVCYGYPMDHQFIITESMDLVAIFKPTNPLKHAVIFMDANGKMIDMQYVIPGEDAIEVNTDIYSKPGYKIPLVKWDKPITEVSEDTIITLQYEKNTIVEYQLTVVNGTGSGDYGYNEVVTIEPDIAPQGTFFSHWEIDGLIVSTLQTYKFTMMRDIEIMAIYAAEVPSDLPLITLSNVLTLRENYYSFSSQFYLPLEYELIDFGILRANEYIENLDLSSPGAEKMKGSKFFFETKEFLMTFPMSVVSVRAYMVVMHENELITYYSNQQDIIPEPTGEDVNQPVLFSGMNPVYWDAEGNEIEKYTNWSPLTLNPSWDDSLWYAYMDTSENLNTSNWANAKSKDGSYWVWIPRYVYTIKSGWNTATAGEIDIKFVIGTNDFDAGVTLSTTGTSIDSNYNGNGGKWSSHPAFKFGTSQITGLWFAKFEASNYYNDVKIIPNVAPWRTISVNDIFNKTRSMETNFSYGWSASEVDTHMMKNSEWGVAAYLAHSKYGRNGVNISRNNTTFYTGGGSYGWKTKANQSTTGNLYGIFDMHGGAHEYVAAYSTIGTNPSQFGASCVAAGSKYCDAYGTNFASSYNFKGDAMFETSSGANATSSWFGALSGWPLATHPWFGRGYLANDARSGTFAYNGLSGDASNSFTFRPVLVPKQ